MARSARLEAVAEGEQAQHPGLCAALDKPRQRTAFGFPGVGLGGQATGLQHAFIKQAAIAQGQITAFHLPGDTPPGQRLAEFVRSLACGGAEPAAELHR